MTTKPRCCDCEHYAKYSHLSHCLRTKWVDKSSVIEGPTEEYRFCEDERMRWSFGDWLDKILLPEGPWTYKPQPQCGPNGKHFEPRGDKPMWVFDWDKWEYRRASE